MTKMKSKKMAKSTFAIIIMGIVMVAMLAFGGTFAYFTATASNKTGEVKTGHVHLTSESTLAEVATTTIMPGDTIFDGNVTYTADVTGDKGEWVAVKLTFTGDGSELLKGYVKLNSEKWEETSEGSGIWVSKAVVINGATIDVLDESVVLPTTFGDGTPWAESETDSPACMDAVITITFKAAAIQGSGVDLATAKTKLADMLK